MGSEAIKELKAYLSTRPTIAPDDYVFINRSGRQLSRRSITNIFARTIDGLKEKGIISFEQKKGKPRTVRLYNLRKFFRKYAGQAGVEYMNFWMGHKTNYKAPHIPEYLSSRINHVYSKRPETVEELNFYQACMHVSEGSKHACMTYHLL